jgi:IMP and pyridine-specific 5'-nucleotidase
MISRVSSKKSGIGKKLPADDGKKKRGKTSSSLLSRPGEESEEHERKQTKRRTEAAAISKKKNMSNGGPKYRFSGAVWKTHRDGLVDLIRSLMHDLASIERGINEGHMLIEEHREAVQLRAERQDRESESDVLEFERTRLERLVPSIGWFFTPLDLVKAYRSYDDEYRMSKRRHMGPSFAEVRHILNLAQLDASMEAVKLFTFDADGTIYDDGHNLEQDSQILQPIIDLLTRGIYVAIVTAAGYPKDAERYETRFRALLDKFEASGVGNTVRSRFFVVGGECNYLFRCTKEYKLEWVDPYEGKPWMLESFRNLDDHESEVQKFLDEAAHTIEATAASIGLDVKMRMIRKPRAIGYIAREPEYVPRKEMLNELVFAAKDRLQSWEEESVNAATAIPFCAFNSGKDVWVDVGHKAIAVQSLQTYLGVRPEETLHVGDQMDAVGNDVRARLSAPSLWVANPKETHYLLQTLLAHREVMESPR